jgi:hypothetical protein
MLVNGAILVEAVKWTAPGDHPDAHPVRAAGKLREDCAWIRTSKGVRVIVSGTWLVSFLGETLAMTQAEFDETFGKGQACSDWD